MAKQRESSGQKWIRFLRGYTPNPRNDAMIAEKIGSLSHRYGVNPIEFKHPLEKKFFAHFLEPNSEPTNVILTGTAGDGKTTLCHHLWSHVTDESLPDGSVVSCIRKEKEYKITFILDFSAWFRTENGILAPECIALLTAFANSINGDGNHYFVLAINDGQFAELWRSLPAESPILALQPLITKLHAENRESDGLRLSFYNLSAISTRELFDRVYDALCVKRSEWQCFSAEMDLPEFSPESPLSRNFQTLKSSFVKNRLRELMRLCDACQYHIPIRELLMWLCNGLLGLTGAPDGVGRPPDIGKAAQEAGGHQAFLHSNLLGLNLRQSQRSRYAIFRFLDNLRLGRETVNDLDELIIFGNRIPELLAAHEELVALDPQQQRDPNFLTLVQQYVDDEESNADVFLAALAAERQRLFLSADPTGLKNATGIPDMWITTVFHSAGQYLREVMDVAPPQGHVSRRILRELVLGINRVWTGHLVGDDEVLIVGKGLDLSSAAISDVFVMKIEIVDAWGNQALQITAPRTGSLVPQFEITWKTGEAPFLFDLTLPRFEFLTRVANGVMPTAFSRECWEDIITLKTRFLRNIYGAGLKLTTIRRLTTDVDGYIKPEEIGI